MCIPRRQYVCTECGYNMPGYCPDFCPFCGAEKRIFITWKECSTLFDVACLEVTGNISRLKAEPPLGPELSSYCIDTGESTIWIDCPPAFDSTLPSANHIVFTHNHLLGAVNLYRRHFHSRVRIHALDSANSLCRGFAFDGTFHDSFVEDGLEAFHINGHTPGFTIYIYEHTLFVSDLVHFDQGRLHLNLFGPQDETANAAKRTHRILESRRIDQVCGHENVVPFEYWMKKFEDMLTAKTRV